MNITKHYFNSISPCGSIMEPHNIEKFQKGLWNISLVSWRM